MKASMFKYKTQLYEINHLLETAHIQKAMEDGTYKPEPGLKFGIKERGHARYITSAATADKAVNHITCDEYLTPLLQKYLQYDNSSSQVGKGVAFHRHRFEIQLRKYYEREGTNEGCIGFSDFSGYYDNIVHEIALAQFGQYLAREIKDPEELADVMDKLRLAFRTFELDAYRFSDEEIEKMYHEKVRSTLNVGIPASALTGEKMLRKGADIGNQVSQNTGIFLPVPIDNYVKIVCAVKGYGRYSDDFLHHRQKQRAFARGNGRGKTVGGKTGYHHQRKENPCLQVVRPVSPFASALFFAGRWADHPKDQPKSYHERTAEAQSL